LFVHGRQAHATLQSKSATQNRLRTQRRLLVTMGMSTTCTLVTYVLVEVARIGVNLNTAPRALPPSQSPRADGYAMSTATARYWKVVGAVVQNVNPMLTMVRGVRATTLPGVRHLAARGPAQRGARAPHVQGEADDGRGRDDDQIQQENVTIVLLCTCRVARIVSLCLSYSGTPISGPRISGKFAKFSVPLIGQYLGGKPTSGVENLSHLSKITHKRGFCFRATVR